MRTQRGLVILLVGANPDLAGVLAEAGHVVKSASDPAAALHAAREALSGLDVVVLDLEQTGQEGYLLARSVRGLSAWRTPLLLALSGPPGAGLTAPPREAGIDLVLDRRVAAEKLLAFLRRFQEVLEDVEAFDPVL